MGYSPGSPPGICTNVSSILNFPGRFLEVGVANHYTFEDVKYNVEIFIVIFPNNNYCFRKTTTSAY